MPNFIEIKKTFCGRTEVRTYVCMYVRTDGRLRPALLQSTLSKSQTKNSQKRSVVFEYFQGTTPDYRNFRAWLM